MIGSSALLLLITGLFAAAACGATTSWQFETETYDYGPQLAGGGPVDHSFVLTNTGETTIRSIAWGIRWWGGLSLDPELFSITSESRCRALEPGESCSTPVAFTPLTPGMKQGELSAYSAGAEPKELGVQLRGEGGSLYVAIEPEVLNLGSVEVGGSATPRTVTVLNQGNVDLTWKGAYLTDLSGNPLLSGAFEIRGDSCVTGLRVAPGGSCMVSIALVPSTAGSLKGKLEIPGSPAGSPGSVELLGTVTAQRPTSSASVTPATSKPRPAKIVCRKGKRKVTKNGKQTCVKKARHRHHRSRRAAE